MVVGGGGNEMWCGAVPCGLYRNGGPWIPRWAFGSLPATANPTLHSLILRTNTRRNMHRSRDPVIQGVNSVAGAVLCGQGGRVFSPKWTATCLQHQPKLPRPTNPRLPIWLSRF